MSSSQRQRAAERRERLAAQFAADRAAAVERARGKARRGRSTANGSSGTSASCFAGAVHRAGRVDVEPGRGRGRTSPRAAGTYFSSGGASLGWAPGAAIGMKLARPEQFVIALCGDGVFNFSSPVAALWGQQKAAAPSLTLVFNNACYSASRVPLRGLYPNGAAVRTGNYMATDINPPPDYAQSGRSVRRPRRDPARPRRGGAEGLRRRRRRRQKRPERRGRRGPGPHAITRRALAR